MEVVNGKENEKQNYNIDPDEKERDSYVRKMFFVDNNSNFEKSKRKYRIHAEDRRIINKYKKQKKDGCHTAHCVTIRFLGSASVFL